MTSRNYFHRINLIKEIPFQQEINLKNGHGRLYYDLNISNGKRKVSVNLGRWTKTLFSGLCFFYLCFLCFAQFEVFAVEVFQCSVQSCASVLLLLVPGGCFFWGFFLWRTSWHLAKTDSLFTFELLYRCEHLRPHASCSGCTRRDQMKSTNRTAITETQII